MTTGVVPIADTTAAATKWTQARHGINPDFVTAAANANGQSDDRHNQAGRRRDTGKLVIDHLASRKEIDDQNFRTKNRNVGRAASPPTLELKNSLDFFQRSLLY